MCSSQRQLLTGGLAFLLLLSPVTLLTVGCMARNESARRDFAAARRGFTQSDRLAAARRVPLTNNTLDLSAPIATNLAGTFGRDATTGALSRTKDNLDPSQPPSPAGLVVEAEEMIAKPAVARTAQPAAKDNRRVVIYNAAFRIVVKAIDEAIKQAGLIAAASRRLIFVADSNSYVVLTTIVPQSQLTLTTSPAKRSFLTLRPGS